jgi:hypothetical protein
VLSFTISEPSRKMVFSTEKMSQAHRDDNDDDDLHFFAEISCRQAQQLRARKHRDADIFINSPRGAKKRGRRKFLRVRLKALNVYF